MNLLGSGRRERRGGAPETDELRMEGVSARPAQAGTEQQRQRHSSSESTTHRSGPSPRPRARLIAAIDGGEQSEMSVRVHLSRRKHIIWEVAMRGFVGASALPIGIAMAKDSEGQQVRVILAERRSSMI